MAFISSLSGSAVAFILPAFFHLVIKQQELKLYHYIFDISVLIFGFLAAALGLVYSGKSLFEGLFHSHSVK